MLSLEKKLKGITQWYTAYGETIQKSNVEGLSSDFQCKQGRGWVVVVVVVGGGGGWGGNV